MRRDLGDFQTPPELAAAVLECLGPIGRRWPRVLEPTCGQGHFIAALLAQTSPPPRDPGGRDPAKRSQQPLCDRSRALGGTTQCARARGCKSTRQTSSASI